MSVELDTGLPSTRFIQSLLKDKQAIEVKLVTGDTVSGSLRWQDPDCICLSVDDQPCLIWRNAIAYLKPLT